MLLPPGKPLEILPRILQAREGHYPGMLSTIRHGTHHTPAESCLSALSARVRMEWVGVRYALTSLNPFGGQHARTSSKHTWNR